MKEFTVLYSGGVDFFTEFFFTRKHEGGRDFLSKLIAIDITEKGIVPLYLPVFTTSWRAGQFTLWINFTRWTYLAILIDRRGIQTKYVDIRKEIDHERNLQLDQ